MEWKEIKCERSIQRKNVSFTAFFDFAFLTFGFSAKSKKNKPLSSNIQTHFTIKSLYLDEYRSHEQTISLNRRKKMIMSKEEAFLFLLCCCLPVTAGDNSVKRVKYN
jgi:hypothetical protein